MKLQEYSAVKDPDSDLDYGRNWGEAEDGTPGWLNDDEVIQTSEWEISCKNEKPPTLHIASQRTGLSDNRRVTGVFLSGGTAGYAYILTNKITTLDIHKNQRTELRTGIIRCCNK